MRGAREIIEETLPPNMMTALQRIAYAELIERHLLAAGVRMIPKGQVDKETLERAASLVDHRLSLVHALTPESAGALFMAIPDAIRSLDTHDLRFIPERNRGWPEDRWQPISTAPGQTVVRVRELSSPFREKLAELLPNGVWSSREGGILLPLYPHEWQPNE